MCVLVYDLMGGECKCCDVHVVSCGRRVCSEEPETQGRLSWCSGVRQICHKGHVTSKRAKIE